jgi:hypothetical protein
MPCWLCAASRSESFEPLGSSVRARMLPTLYVTGVPNIKVEQSLCHRSKPTSASKPGKRSGAA